MGELLDVIEVQLTEPHTVRVLDRGRDKENAEAVVYMAVARRGVDGSFFAVCPANKYRDGDLYVGAHT